MSRTSWWSMLTRRRSGGVPGPYLELWSPGQMSATCRVRLLGDFEVEVDGRGVSPAEWRHRRGSDLVKLLALEPGHRMHRERVMAALWPDLGAEAASANLRKAVHFARRALGGQGAIETGRELVV